MTNLLDLLGPSPQLYDSLILSLIDLASSVNKPFKLINQVTQAGHYHMLGTHGMNHFLLKLIASCLVWGMLVSSIAPIFFKTTFHDFVRTLLLPFLLKCNPMQGF